MSHPPFTRPSRLHPEPRADRSMWTCVARWLVGSALLALLGCASPGVRLVHADLAAPHQPEAATAPTEQHGVVVRREAVVTAHPLASGAGLRMLQAGGSAVDAAIAAQLVLGLVEPQSSGIGGGAFLLHWDGQQLQSYDGRETAPAGVSERLLLDAAGQPLAFHTAAVGGRAVGVPGVLRMLALAHRRHGRLPWATLFEPAI
ncbi:MAG: gamma-glutamyltransferase, partial [Leptothrix sp. (in: b-proteobacteria)]